MQLPKKSFHELKKGILDQSLSPKKTLEKQKWQKILIKLVSIPNLPPLFLIKKKFSGFLKMLFSTAQLKSVQDYSYFSFGGPVFFYLWGSYGVGKSL